MAEPGGGREPAPAEDASLREQVPEGVRSLVRRAVAVVTAGVVAALAWLIVVQEAGKRGYTDLDVNHALGEVWRGPVDTGRVREEEALGVIGDPVAPTGLRVALVCGVVLALVYALVSPLLPLRRWYQRALPLALLVFLVTALVYAPLVESRGVASAGPFGLGAGNGTPIVFAAGALAFGLVAARVHDLMAGARWWEPTSEDTAAASLAAVVTAAEQRGVSSLELAEQGAEKGREGPGA
jgi:hypothetical protein